MFLYSHTLDIQDFFMFIFQRCLSYSSTCTHHLLSSLVSIILSPWFQRWVYVISALNIHSTVSQTPGYFNFVFWYLMFIFYSKWYQYPQWSFFLKLGIYYSLWSFSFITAGWDYMNPCVYLKGNIVLGIIYQGMNMLQLQ